jgi:hypothetical protein
VYTLQPLNAAVVARQNVKISPDTNAAPQIETNQVATVPDDKVIPPERALEALVSTMTPEERQQTLDQIANANQASGGSPGAQQQMQGGNSPAAQAAQAAAQQDLESRIDNRLKNGTVDQRLAHDRRVLNSKQAGAKQ